MARKHDQSLSKREILKAGLSAGMCWGLSFGAARAQQESLWAGDAADLNRAYNVLQRRQPSDRALPKTAAQVARAFADIRASGDAFAIQSSGHCFAGLSQTSGALIDLRYLNQTTVDPDKKRLIAGPGASVAAVNRATSKHGLVLPAGYCQTVALGGHVGGGGIGILSRKYGLACDHLIAAKMLTAQGQLITVSESQNSDLLWALRGGGAGSFGIVTEYQFKLRRPPTLLLAEFRLNLPIKQAAKWMTRWQAIVEKTGPDIGFLSYVYGDRDGMVSISSRLVSTADDRATIPVAKAIAALAPLRNPPTLKKAPFQPIADHLWAPDNYPELPIQITSDLLARPASVDQWAGAFGALTAHPQSLIYLSAEALGGAIDTPEFASAYPHRGAKYLVQYAGDVQKIAPLELRQDAIQKMRSALAPATTGRSYINYADLSQGNWQTAYFGESFERLQQIKRKYDPENTFKHALSIPV